MRLFLLATSILACAGCGGGSDPANPNHPDPDASATPPRTVPKLPAATGVCPTITPGDVMFAPAGLPARRVNLAFDPARTHGPLVIYWHATGSAPAEAAYALGASRDTIMSDGGVIATPSADPSAGQFEWFAVNQSPKLDDFVVADEIVACLAAADRIDPSRIHSMGMSAGALQTTLLSFVRSSYLASVATYSGGIPDGFTPPPPEDPANKFAALIFDGGASDSVFGVDFKLASERYRTTLVDGDHFATICDHGKGHAIPLDAAASVVEFFATNRFGVFPSPYVGGLPASFPAYCAD